MEKLLNILTNPDKRHFWILNRKYCPLKEMSDCNTRFLSPCVSKKVTMMSPKDAQTGPMVRYDQSVMQMQMSMLPDERTREIYRLMADSIHADAECKF